MLVRSQPEHPLSDLSGCCIYIVVNRGPLYFLPDTMESPLLKYISRPAALSK